MWSQDFGLLLAPVTHAESTVGGACRLIRGLIKELAYHYSSKALFHCFTACTHLQRLTYRGCGGKVNDCYQSTAMSCVYQGEEPGEHIACHVNTVYNGFDTNTPLKSESMSRHIVQKISYIQCITVTSTALSYWCP